MNQLRTDDVSGRQSRFHWVTSGGDQGPLPVFDEPVDSNAEGVVVPSLGSIVPGWTLLVPRRRAANFAVLEPTQRRALTGLRQQIKARLGKAFPGTIYEFEHGPARHGGTLGCGVDQAHLHIVPLDLDLIEGVLSIPGDVIRIPADVSDGWELVPEGADYLFVRNTDTNVGVIVLPTTLQSQAIRRIVAAGVESSEAWDYRASDGLQHAMRTRLALAEVSGVVDHSP